MHGVRPPVARQPTVLRPYRRQVRVVSGRGLGYSPAPSAGADELPPSTVRISRRSERLPRFFARQARSQSIVNRRWAARRHDSGGQGGRFDDSRCKEVFPRPGRAEVSANGSVSGTGTEGRTRTMEHN